jgi:hypothetical protein
MDQYVDELLSDVAEDMGDGVASTPAAEYLYERCEFGGSEVGASKEGDISHIDSKAFISQ